MSNYHHYYGETLRSQDTGTLSSATVVNEPPQHYDDDLEASAAYALFASHDQAHDVQGLGTHIRGLTRPPHEHDWPLRTAGEAQRVIDEGQRQMLEGTVYTVSQDARPGMGDFPHVQNRIEGSQSRDRTWVPPYVPHRLAAGGEGFGAMPGYCSLYYNATTATVTQSSEASRSVTHVADHLQPANQSEPSDQSLLLHQWADLGLYAYNRGTPGFEDGVQAYQDWIRGQEPFHQHLGTALTCGFCGRTFRNHDSFRENHNDALGHVHSALTYECLELEDWKSPSMSDFRYTFSWNRHVPNIPSARSTLPSEVSYHGSEATY